MNEKYNHYNEAETAKNQEKKTEISIDILKHIEDLSNKINGIMASRAKTVFKRYPITFGLLILFGATALHEGLKGLLDKFGLLNINPWYLLITGVIVLTITGTLYKKLNEDK